MTIKKYLQGLESANLKPVESGEISFVDAMQESTEIWNSDACKGILFGLHRLRVLIRSVFKRFYQYTEKHLKICLWMKLRISMLNIESGIL